MRVAVDEEASRAEQYLDDVAERVVPSAGFGLELTASAGRSHCCPGAYSAQRRTAADQMAIAAFWRTSLSSAKSARFRMGPEMLAVVAGRVELRPAEHQPVVEPLQHARAGRAPYAGGR